MVATAEPITDDITIICGTDHRFIYRRVDEDGEPLIPVEAKAQIRNNFNGSLWVDAVINIDSAGWVTVSVPKAVTEGPAWNMRKSGVWDLKVKYENEILMWVRGIVTVVQDVTEYAN